MGFLDPVLIAAGANVLRRSFVRRLRGWKRYPGTVEAVCHGALEDCWTGEFYAGSAGHFRQFWTRDLAMCTPALLRLGQRERVIRSWEWGLERFERAGRIATTIFFGRFPRDVYDYACDSLPLLLRALRDADADHLVRRHQALLAREIARYHALVFDPDSGMARAKGYFSSPRDCMTGRSTASANAFLGSLQRTLADFPWLPQPFGQADIGRRLRETHWTGEYFRDALDREAPSGDGNVWPFHFGLFGEEGDEMRRSAFRTLEARGFTSPVPLRYFERRLPKSELFVPWLFTPNYQGDTSWTQMGPIYLKLLREIDEWSFLAQRQAMSAMIDRDRNYLEVYLPDGRPYRGRAGLYQADEGMIWAAMFLDLL